MTTWLALFILAFAAILLVADESGMIAGLDSTIFGYVALCLALRTGEGMPHVSTTQGEEIAGKFIGAQAA